MQSMHTVPQAQTSEERFFRMDILHNSVMKGAHKLRIQSTDAHRVQNSPILDKKQPCPGLCWPYYSMPGHRLQQIHSTHAFQTSSSHGTFALSCAHTYSKSKLCSLHTIRFTPLPTSFPAQASQGTTLQQPALVRH